MPAAGGSGERQRRVRLSLAPRHPVSVDNTSQAAIASKAACTHLLLRETACACPRAAAASPVALLPLLSVLLRAPEPATAGKARPDTKAGHRYWERSLTQ